MKTQQMTIPEMTEVEHRLKTPSRTMSSDSLRPGDFLRGPTGLIFCVMINSSKLERVVLWVKEMNHERVFEYGEFSSLALISHGKPRYWWFYLPTFLKNRVCMYRRVK